MLGPVRLVGYPPYLPYPPKFLFGLNLQVLGMIMQLDRQYLPSEERRWRPAARPHPCDPTPAV